MKRAVSVLTVADDAVMNELSRVVPMQEHLGERVGDGWVVGPTFEREVIPKLREQGVSVLIRLAVRPRGSLEHDDLEPRLRVLTPRARELLHTAQRHAIDGMVVGIHAWDPVLDAPVVRELLGLGLLDKLELEPNGPEDYVASSSRNPQRDDPSERSDRGFAARSGAGGGKHAGRYALHPDLPPPPEIAYDFAEAAMPEPTDLNEGRPGPLALLHDLASLAAAIDLVTPKRTLAGLIGAVDSRKLQDRLCTAKVTRLEEHPRWGQALRALEALGVVTLHFDRRELGLDLGLERTLMGSTEQALDHLLHRLVDADLHSAVPAVRAALRDAGDGAVDEVVFQDLLAEQHREVLFAPWHREGAPTYPALEGEQPREFDRDSFDEVEVPMLGRLLGRLERLGLVRRAPGVFAGTPDGRRWAKVEGQPLPPIWVSSDLELVVPPDGLTPWERFQVERLGRCLSRDVVDRYRLERAGVEAWLRHHEIDEALALLQRRSPAVPESARLTLLEWARQASRVVVTRGVILEAPTGHGG